MIKSKILCSKYNFFVFTKSLLKLNRLNVCLGRALVCSGFCPGGSERCVCVLRAVLRPWLAICWCYRGSSGALRLYFARVVRHLLARYISVGGCRGRSVVLRLYFACDCQALVNATLVLVVVRA